MAGVKGRSGRPRANMCPVQEHELYLLYRRHGKSSAVARVLGVWPDTVCRWMRDAGVEVRRGGPHNMRGNPGHKGANDHTIRRDSDGTGRSE